jgi:hypothetical protein
MANVHSTSKRRSGRNRASKPKLERPSRRSLSKQGRQKSQDSDRGTVTRIRGRLREFMQSEQGFLLKTQSLLLCMAHSMDEGSHPSTGPYYPDVVELASELISRRALNFDDLLLDGRLPAENAREVAS